MIRKTIPSGKVRTAGSLETNRSLKFHSPRTEIERETTRLYDDIFSQPDNDRIKNSRSTIMRGRRSNSNDYDDQSNDVSSDDDNTVRNKRNQSRSKLKSNPHQSTPDLIELKSVSRKKQTLPDDDEDQRSKRNNKNESDDENTGWDNRRRSKLKSNPHQSTPDLIELKSRSRKKQTLPDDDDDQRSKRNNKNESDDENTGWDNRRRSKLKSNPHQSTPDLIELKSRSRKKQTLSDDDEDQHSDRNNNVSDDDVVYNRKSIDETGKKVPKRKTNSSDVKKKHRSSTLSSSSDDDDRRTRTNKPNKKNNPFLVKSLESVRKISLEDNEFEEETRTIVRSKSKQAQPPPPSINRLNQPQQQEQPPHRHHMVRPMTAADSYVDEIPRNDFTQPYFRDIGSQSFIFRLAPRQPLVRCKIRVRPNTLKTDDYELFVEDFGSEKVLLNTQSELFGTGVHLWIKANDLNRSKSSVLVGRLEAKFNRKKYSLTGVDGEHNSNDLTKDDYDDSSLQREQFELVYHNAMMVSNKPKDIEIRLNVVDDETTSSSRETNLKAFKLVSKKAVFDTNKKKYKMNFRGRAKQASTNNLQIINESESTQLVLQLGKEEKNEYNLDFAYPFSVFTAFGVALSCLTRN